MPYGKRYIVGVDLGQQADPTGIVVLERSVEEIVRYGLDGEPHRDYAPSDYNVVEIARIPLGIPYPEQVRALVALVRDLRAENPDLGGQPYNGVQVVLDATGLGKPVADLLREELGRVGIRGNLAVVTFTGGLKTTRHGWRSHVPKGDLVSTLDLALQQERVKVAGELPLAKELLHELANLKRSLNEKTGRDTYGNLDPAVHDDLAMALAVALWWGEAHPGAPSLPRSTVPVEGL